MSKNDDKEYWENFYILSADNMPRTACQWRVWNELPAEEQERITREFEEKQLKQKRDYEAEKLREMKRLGISKHKFDALNLTDNYIKYLLTNKTDIKPNIIPDDLIELKRLQLRVKRALGENKEGILFICKTHGALTEEYVTKKGVRNGHQQYRCKECYKNLKAVHYIKHKEKISAKHKKYRDENPEKRRETKYRSWLKNKDKYHASKLIHDRRHKRKCIDNLFDSYVKDQLTKRSDFLTAEIPEQLIELKRIVIQMKRYVYKKNTEQRLLNRKLNEVKIK